MPNWIDASILVLFVGALILELKRGFGRAVFDLAAFLVALRVTWMLNEPLSASVQLAADSHMNQAVIYALGFVVIGGPLIYVGKLLHAATLISGDVFDPMLCSLCGLAIATIATHTLVQTITLGAGGDGVPAVVAGSVFGTEFLRFDTYHQVLEQLYNFHREPAA